LNQQQNEVNMDVVKDLTSIENAIKSFWEKAHAASDIISNYQTEQKILLENNSKLEKELKMLRVDFIAKEQDFKRLQAEHTRLINSTPSDGFAIEEKENLKNKIRDLLVKINSHL
jgi:hypothetical protein